MFDPVERTAQSIAHYGSTYLSLSEEMALQNNRSFYNAVMARVDEIRSAMEKQKQSEASDKES